MTDPGPGLGGRFLHAILRVTSEDSIRRLVEATLREHGLQKFDRAACEGYLKCRSAHPVTLVALGPDDEIPLGQQYEVAFRMEDPDTWESVDLTVEHIVFEFGVPLAKTEKGHKHFIAFRSGGPMGEVLGSLPAVDPLAPLDPGARPPRIHDDIGLCARTDGEAVRDLVKELNRQFRGRR